MGPAGADGVDGATGPAGPSTVSDAVFTVQDDADATRQMRFQLSGVSPGMVRTLGVPNASGDIVLATGPQLITGKTFDGTNRQAITTKTGNYAITTADKIVLVNAAATMTLPSAAGVGAGVTFNLRNIHASATATVNTAGGSINGAGSFSLGPGVSITTACDGAAWWTL
jgi:hypothetical protein